MKSFSLMIAVCLLAGLSECQVADEGSQTQITEVKPEDLVVDTRVEEEEVEPDSTLDKEAEEPDNGPEGKHEIANRFAHCPSGWSLFNGRCFRYFVAARTWAEAQRHCQSMGGHLASVHNVYEENWIRRFVHYRPTWLGLSDAEQNRYWFWSDGTRFTYSHWCRGEPSDIVGYQNCLQMNYSDQKCWDDVSCLVHRGYVCAHR